MKVGTLTSVGALAGMADAAITTADVKMHGYDNGFSNVVDSLAGAAHAIYGTGAGALAVKLSTENASGVVPLLGLAASQFAQSASYVVQMCGYPIQGAILNGVGLVGTLLAGSFADDE